MANRKPAPRMNYAAWIKTEIQAGHRFGPRWTQEVFRRAYGMMKTDPYYKDGETFDYNGMQNDAVMAVSSTDREGLAAAGSTIIELMEKDPVWQQKQYEAEVEADVTELNQEDASALQALEKEQKAAARKTKAAQRPTTGPQGQPGNWVTLAGGRRVFIPQK